MAEETKEQSKDFKYLVRIANTDLDGNKQLLNALTKIKGFSLMFSNMLCNFAKIDQTKKTGTLTDAEIERLNQIVLNPIKAGAPSWMLNRRKDYVTGEDMHIITNDLRFIKDNDLKRLKKIKSYKGLRHQLGLPVRGQRTKSNFRKNKGKAVAKKKKELRK